MPRAHQAGFSRRSVAGVAFFESVRNHGPALLTNGGVQQQQHLPTQFNFTRALGDGPRHFEPWSSDMDDT
ncbi:hypothetical protein TNCV_484091 [Trichonephila clavipes]|nr:hypothetical protein TNCV_484091 [Trichonephila clavipes]